MWDVWFGGQIVCSKIEHLSNIDEITDNSIIDGLKNSKISPEIVWVWGVQMKLQEGFDYIVQGRQSVKSFFLYMKMHGGRINFWSFLRFLFASALAVNPATISVLLVTRCKFTSLLFVAHSRDLRSSYYKARRN